MRHPEALVTKLAIALAGDVWDELDEAARELYREDAYRSLELFDVREERLSDDKTFLINARYPDKRRWVLTSAWEEA